MGETAEVPDVLKSPEIRAHTKRIRSLRAREKRIARRLGSVMADIGDALFAAKAALDRTRKGKTSWLRWLAKHARFSERSAHNYMSIAKMRLQNPQALADFRDAGPTCLFRIAALPPELQEGAHPDNVLPIPGTGKEKPIREMSTRELDLALDHLQGPRRGRAGEGAVQLKVTLPPIKGSTREEFAKSAIAATKELAAALPRIHELPGKLEGDSKQEGMNSANGIRLGYLDWPAWPSGTPRHVGWPRKKRRSSARQASAAGGKR